MPEAASLDREDVLVIDYQTVDDTLEVTEPSNSGGYETSAREPTRKADVGKDLKASHL